MSSVAGPARTALRPAPVARASEPARPLLAVPGSQPALSAHRPLSAQPAASGVAAYVLPHPRSTVARSGAGARGCRRRSCSGLATKATGYDPLRATTWPQSVAPGARRPG